MKRLLTPIIAGGAVIATLIISIICIVVFEPFLPRVELKYDEVKQVSSFEYEGRKYVGISAIFYDKDAFQIQRGRRIAAVKGGNIFNKTYVFDVKNVDPKKQLFIYHSNSTDKSGEIYVVNN